MDPGCLDGPRSFWNTETITSKLDLLIESPDLELDVDQVKEAACELRLGPEAYISGTQQKTLLNKGDLVAIAPGRIALLLTEEVVKVPPNALGFISLKTRVKLPGLINVSGFHVDPGFEGRLIFTVYNAGTQTCVFMRGQRMFLIWFASLSEREKEQYAGSRLGQTTISADDISRLTEAGASPAELNERLARLEVREKVAGALLVALLVAVLAILIGG